MDVEGDLCGGDIEEGGECRGAVSTEYIEYMAAVGRSVFFSSRDTQ